MDKRFSLNVWCFIVAGVFVTWSNNSVIKTWRILGGNSSCAMPLCHLNCKNELKLQLTSWRIQIVKSFINCKKSTPSSYFSIFNIFSANVNFSIPMIVIGLIPPDLDLISVALVNCSWIEMTQHNKIVALWNMTPCIY